MHIAYQEILLRDTQPEDVDAYLRWMTSGEWRYYDAPWEGITGDGIADSLTPAQQENFRQSFLAARKKPQPTPRQRVTLALADGTPIGWVSRYGTERFKAVWYLGIDICEDEYLNRGLGSQALTAWANYLFENSDVHKLEIHTWTMNPRMMHLSEKLGYIFEGRERELIQWQGEWIDRVRYGMLRAEWEEKRKTE